MMDNMKYDRAFLTGADSNTEWMLPWFFENYKKHNDTPLIFADFGVTDLDYVRENVHAVMNLTNIQEQGWFKKPKAMLHCPAKRTVWIDTDCEVLGDLSNIFSFLHPGKLNMVEDKPWSRRMRETWYNSGIVGFVDKPKILGEWAKQVQDNPQRGDQETLHAMLDPLSQMTYINPIPNIYNWLRVQLENDEQDNDSKLVMHWTGAKGKDRIREKMSA